MTNDKTNMPVIRVDWDVLAHLRKNAQPFETRPAVLRRLLGLPPKRKKAPGPKPNGRRP